jgi:hypothetical protein
MSAANAANEEVTTVATVADDSQACFTTHPPSDYAVAMHFKIEGPPKSEQGAQPCNFEFAFAELNDF